MQLKEQAGFSVSRSLKLLLLLEREGLFDDPLLPSRDIYLVKNISIIVGLQPGVQLWDGTVGPRQYLPQAERARSCADDAAF